ncbi:MAG TPA: glycosyltransferase family 4 protein [Chloroflexota bacterium]
MHLAVVCINYAPELTGISVQTTALCEHLARQGHKVSVITAFPFAPHWRVFPGYRGRLFQREDVNGVSLYRVKHFIPARPRRLLERLLHDATFALGAFLASFLVGDVDLVLYIGAQPAAALSALAAARLRKRPFAAKVTDLAVEAGVAVGTVRSGLLAKVFGALEYAIYRAADSAIVLCDGFADALIEHGLPRNRLATIHDSVDLELVRPLADDGAFRAANGLAGDDFVVMHSGSISFKQGLDVVLAAARRAGRESKVKWVLVGDGPDRRRLEAERDRARLHAAIALAPFQPVEKLAQTLSAADALLLTQLAGITSSALPSKLLMYMAAGRPVVASVSGDSESARLIRQADCGLVAPAEDPAGLLDAIERLRADPELGRRLGSNGRAFAERHFDRDKIVAAQQRLLEAVARPAPDHQRQQCVDERPRS